MLLDLFGQLELEIGRISSNNLDAKLTILQLNLVCKITSAVMKDINFKSCFS